MSKQILLCVETNKKSRTDYKYISETIKKFYNDDKKIIYRPIFLETKTRYKEKSVLKEIKDRIKQFKGTTNVIYFIDYDDCNLSSETKKLFEEIERYCQNNSYDFVFFVDDIEDVYWGYPVSDCEKVKKADEFSRKKVIETVNECCLKDSTYKRHTSNILNILDKYWKRK